MNILPEEVSNELKNMVRLRQKTLKMQTCYLQILEALYKFLKN